MHRVGRLLLNMGRSHDCNLVRRDWKAHQLKGWKLRSRRIGSFQHDNCDGCDCDGCDREPVLHDKPLLLASTETRANSVQVNLPTRGPIEELLEIEAQMRKTVPRALG
jgi:hypothetical protein